MEMQVQISKKVAKAYEDVNCVVSGTQISGFQAETDAASVHAWKLPNSSEFKV